MRGTIPRSTASLGLTALLLAISLAASPSWAENLTYIYDDLGRLESLTYEDGTQILYSYDLGTIVERYAYGPYGEEASAPGGTPFRFTGQRFDAETGLYHYRARAYSPALGRFLQPDPIGTEGGINLYAYVNNDPINLTDPLGLFTITLGLSFDFGIGAATGGLAFSFPDPFTGGELDFGLFAELGGMQIQLTRNQFQALSATVSQELFSWASEAEPLRT